MTDSHTILAVLSACAAAISNLRSVANRSEITAAARAAVQPLLLEFEQQERKREQQEERARDEALSASRRRLSSGEGVSQARAR
jgi:hypothetical protein